MGTSLLTNQSSMTALQTLRGIGDSMDQTQRRVSTGLRINEASENTAYWSISSMMKHDRGALSAVSDAMNLGKNQIDIASTATDATKKYLDDIQKTITQTYSKGEGDIEKIQDNVKANMENISSAVVSASLAEKNILASDGGEVSIAGGYRREGGSVYVDMIKVGGANLNFGKMDDAGQLDMKEGVLKNVFGKGTDGKDAADAFQTAVEAQNGFVKALADAEAALKADPTNTTKQTAVTDAKSDLNGNATAFKSAQDTFKTAAKAITLDEFTKMEGLSKYDDSVQKILIEGVQSTVKSAVDATVQAGSELGASKMKVQNQVDFVSKLMDNIDKGIGSLVDADMNAESARLASLQVQQQLGIQALSISNQNSQNILSLFRQ